MKPQNKISGKQAKSFYRLFISIATILILTLLTVGFFKLVSYFTGLDLVWLVISWLIVCKYSADEWRKEIKEILVGTLKVIEDLNESLGNSRKTYLDGFTLLSNQFQTFLNRFAK